VAATLDWRQWRDEQAQRLLQMTGHDLATWAGRVRAAGLDDRSGITAWLAERGISGYAAMLLRYEQLGYPDFMTATADSLVDAQYGDRTHLRAIYEAILEAALDLGEVTIQTRKGYVSLLTPRRTFARVQATTKTRVDLGLRLEGVVPGGRLRVNRAHENMPVQLSFHGLDDLDEEARGWLIRAYNQNL
jgi:hypothetical protein